MKTGHEGIRGRAEQCRVRHKRRARDGTRLRGRTGVRDERGFSRVEAAAVGLGWVGLGFPFFPELLCPSDPTAASHPGQEQLPRSPENNGG